MDDNQLKRSAVTGIDRYSDYMPPITEIFDLSVYSKGLKEFRAVHCSKPNEDRPFNMVEDTFDDMIITARIPEDARVYHHPKEIEEIVPTKTQYVTLSSSDKKYDFLFAEMCFEKKIFFTDAHKGPKWSIMGIFMKGYFGDNEEAYQLFKLFSMMVPSLYDEAVNREKWDGFASKESYSNFGIFVNWAKKYDKKLYDEVNYEIKILKKCDKNDDGGKNDSQKIYDTLVQDFELTHTKIVNDSLYLKETDDSIITMSRQKLVASYEHMQCGVNSHGTPVSFINKWITCNDKINRKDFMNVYPDSSKCPDNAFNLWRPFAMEKVSLLPYEKISDGLTFILNHIKVLCDYDEKVYNYFIKWIAYMIQFPDKKIPCIVLISNQGAGKTSFILLLKKMLGAKKVIECSDPARDVWGDFNALMMDAFLVNLSEVGFADSKDSMGKLKALITDETININQKGVSQITVSSYHHFIATTNKSNPFEITKDCRRFVVVRSSDDKIGNIDYFSELYALMEDSDTIRTVYNYFKELDLSSYKPTEIPSTEHLDGLKSMSTSPIEDWLQDFTIQNMDQSEPLKLNADDIFEHFKSWLQLNPSRKFETNKQKLGIKMSYLKIPGITKGDKDNKGCATKMFDFELLKKHFQISCE